jgi:hypothetical protein
MPMIPQPAADRRGANMKKIALGIVALAVAASTPASAAVFNFTFDTTSTLFGGPNQTIRGTFTTTDTAVEAVMDLGVWLIHPMLDEHLPQAVSV